MLVTANNLFAQKEVFILRKKSHILLARYLADQMPATKSLQSHGKIRRLVENGLGEYNDRVFWRRAGEIMHYIADYFTFPHNRTFDGSLRQHNTYEKHLKNELKAFVESGRADIYAEKNLRFDTLNQLLDYIRERHNVYLDRKRSIEEDIHYILSVCFQVFQGLFQLCLRVVASGVPAVNI